VWEEFERRREEAGFARHIVRPDQAPLGVRLLSEGIGSLRGAIGTPEQVTDLVTRYERAGVDQVIFVVQAGRNRHEDICESIELFAAEVLPRFVDGRAEQDASKAERLAAPIEAALARREAARAVGSPPYVIDEQAELARARRRATTIQSPRAAAAAVVRQAQRAARARAAALLARLVHGASEAEIERRFGSAPAQWVLFGAMARAFEPDAAVGFQGNLVYELSRPATGEPPTVWTLAVTDGHATARPGAAGEAALTVRFTLADFVRIAAGAIDPAQPLLEDRASFEGDFALAARLPEMFGAPSPY
jgi:hypothetical protein